MYSTALLKSDNLQIFFFSKCIIKIPYQLWCEWELNKQQNCVFSAAWKIPNIGCYLQLATGADVLILEYFFAHSIFIQARRKSQQLNTQQQQWKGSC